MTGMDMDMGMDLSAAASNQPTSAVLVLDRAPTGGSLRVARDAARTALSAQRVVIHTMSRVIRIAAGFVFALLAEM